MTCSTLCARFTLRPDGHRCSHCGLLVSDAIDAHKPEKAWKDKAPYTSAVLDNEYTDEYRAWIDWQNALNVLAGGGRHVDVSKATLGDAHPRRRYGPAVYLLGHNGTNWGVIPPDHETTAWGMFVPIWQEPLPSERQGVRGKNGKWALPEHMAFVTFSSGKKPGFIDMTLCDCGWFRLAAEPVCTYHDESPGFPVPGREANSILVKENDA